MTTNPNQITSRRAPKAGYREHDHSTEWQECDTCRLRTGAGITTAWDAAYYAGDPDVCPRCADRGHDGRMALPVAMRMAVVYSDTGMVLGDGATKTEETASSRRASTMNWRAGQEQEHQESLTRQCEGCSAVGHLATSRWCYDCWDAILTDDLSEREIRELDDEEDYDAR